MAVKFITVIGYRHGTGAMCFKVDAETLEAISCEYYDAWAIENPPEPNMSYMAWSSSLNDKMLRKLEKEIHGN